MPSSSGPTRRKAAIGSGSPPPSRLAEPSLLATPPVLWLPGEAGAPASSVLPRHLPDGPPPSPSRMSTRWDLVDRDFLVAPASHPEIQLPRSGWRGRFRLRLTEPDRLWKIRRRASEGGTDPLPASRDPSVAALPRDDRTWGAKPNDPTADAVRPWPSGRRDSNPRPPEPHAVLAVKQILQVVEPRRCSGHRRCGSRGPPGPFVVGNSPQNSQQRDPMGGPPDRLSRANGPTP